MKTELEVAYNRFKSRTQDIKEFIGQLEDLTRRIGIARSSESIKIELEQKINLFKRKMEI